MITAYTSTITSTITMFGDLPNCLHFMFDKFGSSTTAIVIIWLLLWKIPFHLILLLCIRNKQSCLLVPAQINSNNATVRV